MSGERSVMDMEETKVCGGCGRELPVISFYISKKNPDGLTKWCKYCLAAYNKERRNHAKFR